MRFVRSITIGFFLYLMWVGCGSREPYVATIGREHGITMKALVEDYTKAKRGMKTRSEMLYVKRHLDSMVSQRIKLVAAYEHGLDKDSALVERAEAIKAQKMIEALYQKEVVDRVIKETDIREQYARMGKEVFYHAIHIPVLNFADTARAAESRRKVEDALARIHAGEDFLSVARDVSGNSGSPSTGERMGPFSWKGNSNPVLSEAFSMNIGDISGVIETRRGFHIIRLEDIRKKDRQPYPQVREEIRGILLREKNKEIGQRAVQYLEDLKATNDVRWYDDALDTVYQHLRSIHPPLPDSLLAALDRLSAEEKMMTMVSYAGEEGTVGMLMDIVGKYPKGRAVQISNVGILKRILDRKVVYDVLFKKAEDLRLDNSKEVKESVQQGIEAEMVRLVEEKIIFQDIQPTEEALRAFFEENKMDRYADPEKRSVQEIMVKDKNLAESIARQVQEGHPFDDLVQEYTERPGYKKRNGIIPFFAKGRWGKLGERAFEMKVGQTAGPIDLGNDKGFSVIKLLEIRPKRIKTFEVMRGIVKRDFERGARIEREQDWLARKKEVYGVQIYEDVLQRAVEEISKQN